MSRHILIAGAQPVPVGSPPVGGVSDFDPAAPALQIHTPVEPDPASAESEAAAAIAPERWSEFLRLVRETRHLQRLYRKTMDPLLRRESERFEDSLDYFAGFLAADMAAALTAKASVLDVIERAGDPTQYGPKTLVTPAQAEVIVEGAGKGGAS